MIYTTYTDYKGLDDRHETLKKAILDFCEGIAEANDVEACAERYGFYKGKIKRMESIGKQVEKFRQIKGLPSGWYQLALLTHLKKDTIQKICDSAPGLAPHRDLIKELKLKLSGGF